MANILLIEDEENIASFISRGLIEYGNNVTVTYNCCNGWDLMQNSNADVIVLDIILPDGNGLELCQRFRNKFGYTTPILMLTALETTENIIQGLNAGADDYLTKPFKFKEFTARISALLRRTNAENYEQHLQISDLKLDVKTKRAIRSGNEIMLTVREFKLLYYFMTNTNTLLSRFQILENVWDIRFDTNTNIVDVYVNYLRNKIDKIYPNKLIHTVVGMGYIMEVR